MAAALADDDREAAALRGALVALETRTLEAARTERERTLRVLASHQRERDALHRALVKAQALTAKQRDQVRVLEASRKTLEAESRGARAASRAERARVYELEADASRLAAEAASNASEHAAALAEVKRRSAVSARLQKRIDAADAKLRQQQALYRTVRADANAYSKSLVEAQAEIADIRRRFKVMLHQTEQLKEEIHAKDKDLVREHFVHVKAEKEIEMLREQLREQRELRGKSEALLDSAGAESARLGALIGDADAEAARQGKECERVAAERALLGAQLTRRADELAALRERVRLLESTLHKGGAHWRDRTREEADLTRRIAALRAEADLADGDAAAADAAAMREEAHQLERELVHERTKLRALTDELERPMNVHRWRELESSDPASFELVQKVSILQRRLVERSEEVVDKELLAAQKERLLSELKALLARQPGPEVSEQLRTHKRALAERERQLATMAAELHASYDQVDEYAAEIERIGKELRETKARYYEQKKRDEAVADASRPSEPPQRAVVAAAARGARPRFTGGGFNLNQRAARATA